MNHTRVASIALVSAALAACAAGCGASMAQSSGGGSGGYTGGTYHSAVSGSTAEASAPSSAGGVATGYSRGPAATVAPRAYAGGADHAGGGASGGAAVEPPPEYRSGLATTWGESRYDPLSYAPFYRASSAPFATAGVRYNDAQGAMAQAYYRGGASPVQFVGAYNNGVRISIRDESGNPLPGQIVGDTLYVIGQHGQHYSINVINQTPARFEAVVSVDGLDVISGRDADFSQRGYILQPYGTLTIEGFRQSESSVAAFRFGTVADSYAAQTGSARNVGVIGVALFAEQGWSPTPYTTPGEVELRETADPFPGRFAPPPPRRVYPY